MAEATFVSEGNTIDYTPGADVAAGEVVVLGDLVAVAKRPILAGELGSLAVAGAFDFAKNAIDAFSVGQLLYWDNTANEATATATSNKLIGKVVVVAFSTDTTVRIRMSQ